MKQYTINSYIGESEAPIEVNFDYEPAEKMILHPIDKAYPGCPASVEITEILMFGVEIGESLSEKEMDRLQTECEDSI